MSPPHGRLSIRPWPIPREFLAARRTSDPGWEAWCRGLSYRIPTYASVFSVVLQPGCYFGHDSLVTLGTQRGEPVALKIGFGVEGIASQCSALTEWDARGMVALKDHRAHEGVLLLEQLSAATPLSSLPLSQACEIAGKLISTLAIPSTSPFLTTREIAAPLVEGIGVRNAAQDTALPAETVRVATEAAERIAQRALDMPRRLLHADLHFDNILQAPTGEWRAIDPRPRRGDPEASLPEMMWSRVDELDDPHAIRSQLAALCVAGDLDPERARDWTMLRAVDYWLWGLENDLTIDPVRCSRVVAALH